MNENIKSKMMRLSCKNIRMCIILLLLFKMKEMKRIEEVAFEYRKALT